LNYTKHILEMGHKYGPVQEVMGYLAVARKRTNCGCLVLHVWSVQKVYGLCVQPSFKIV